MTTEEIRKFETFMIECGVCKPDRVKMKAIAIKERDEQEGEESVPVSPVLQLCGS